MEKYQKYDLLVIYRNYIFALQTREEFGEIYGDTKEIIDYYEQILTKARVLRLEKRK